MANKVALFSHNCRLNFLIGDQLTLKSVEPNSFESDLILIESSLPQIIAHALIKFLLDGGCDFATLSAWLEKENPLKFDQSLGHKFYEYKLKTFLIGLCDKKQLLAMIGYKLPYYYLLRSARLSFQSIGVDVTDNSLSITSYLSIELSL